jgi:hypothetical protein
MLSYRKEEEKKLQGVGGIGEAGPGNIGKMAKTVVAKKHIFCLLPPPRHP